MYHYQYQGTKLKKKPVPRGLLVIALVAVVLIVTCVLIIKSGFFTVTNIVVNGNNPRLSQEIQAYLQKNFVFLVSSPYKTSETLQAVFPEVERATLAMNIFSKTLNASYTLKTPYFLWCKQEICFLVDKKGVIFTRSEIVDASFLLTIQDDYYADVAIGRSIPDNHITALLQLERMLKGSGLSTNRIIISQAFSVRIPINGAGELRFTFQKPIEDQINNFIAFYDSVSKTEFAQLAYVDLRVKDKVYYK